MIRVIVKFIVKYSMAIIATPIIPIASILIWSMEGGGTYLSILREGLEEFWR